MVNCYCEIARFSVVFYVTQNFIQSLKELHKINGSYRRPALKGQAQLSNTL